MWPKQEGQYTNLETTINNRSEKKEGNIIQNNREKCQKIMPVKKINKSK